WPDLPRQAVAEAAVMSGGSIVEARQLAADEAWRAAVAELAANVGRGSSLLETAAPLAGFEFDALWVKEQADTGLSAEELAKQCSDGFKPKKDDPPRVMTKERRNELLRQAMLRAYDR